MKTLFTTILVSLILAPIMFFAAAKGVPVFAQTDTGAVINSKSKLEQIGQKTGFLKSGGTLLQGDKPFYDRFAQIVNIVLGLIGILVTVYIIYSGVKWITAGGNEEQVKGAKEGIRNAVTGLAVILLGFVVVNFLIYRVLEVATK